MALDNVAQASRRYGRRYRRTRRSALTASYGLRV